MFREALFIADDEWTHSRYSMMGTVIAFTFHWHTELCIIKQVIWVIHACSNDVFLLLFLFLQIRDGWIWVEKDSLQLETSHLCSIMHLKMGAMFRVVRAKKAELYIASRTNHELLAERQVYVIHEAILHNKDLSLSEFVSKHCAIAKETRSSKILHVMSFMTVSNAVLAHTVPLIWEAIQTNVLILKYTLLSCL